ncbi:hypothetical protein Pan44_13430 [Caulifigura coniformis]|uniref:Uncharacterized protein n=1 Tax=Caulifigura coniformis TaxID=2527983 RepID=A0A517SB10_9PLAN|nr:hypothetical protein Pan44_13430 [Caulifigura coniformis]
MLQGESISWRVLFHLNPQRATDLPVARQKNAPIFRATTHAMVEDHA